MSEQENAKVQLAEEIARRCRYWLGREDKAQASLECVQFYIDPAQYESDLHFLLAICEAAGA